MFVLGGSAVDLRQGWTRRDVLRVGVGTALGAAGSGFLTVAGLAGNTFGLAFSGDVLVEAVDDVLQLLVAVRLLSVG